VGNCSPIIKETKQRESRRPKKGLMDWTKKGPMYRRKNCKNVNSEKAPVEGELGPYV
jgi:hypothetical protein